MTEVPRTTRYRPPNRRLGRRVSVAAIAAALPAALLVVVTSNQAGAAVPAAPSGWTTAFSDDFNGAAGTGLNTADWLYDTGTSYPGGAANWGTSEVETVTDSTNNVYQDGNGHLIIKPIRDSNDNWTSGRIETQRTDFAAPAGGQMEITASIEQPDPASGLGYWPAFWAMGAAARPVGATNWPSIGELDIMEDVNALSEVSHTFHCGVDPNGPCDETTGIGSGLLACSGCQTAFHTYSVIVDRTNTSAEQLRFYTDGVLQHTVNESQVPVATWTAAVDHGFFPILNVAMGGAYPDAICKCSTEGGALNSVTSGAAMSVDYVAVYVKSGSGTSSPTPTPTPTPTGTPGSGAGAGSTIQAEAYDAQSGTGTEATADTGGGLDVDAIANGDWLQYDSVDFGATPVSQFSARVASGATGGASGLVEVHLDSLSNPSIGSFAVGNTGGWQSWTTIPANINPTTGTHTVFLTFVSGQPADYVNVNWFTFPGGPTSGDATPTPTPSPTPTPTPTSSPGGFTATSTIQAEAYSAQAGTTTETTTDTGGGQDVTSIANGDQLRFDNVDFGTTGLTQFKARVASGAAGGVSGLIEVHLDNPGSASIGSFAVGNTGGWQSWTTVPANINATTGTHTVYLEFTSGQPANYVSVNWFTFSR